VYACIPESWVNLGSMFVLYVRKQKSEVRGQRSEQDKNKSKFDKLFIRG